MFPLLSIRSVVLVSMAVPFLVVLAVAAVVVAGSAASASPVSRRFPLVGGVEDRWISWSSEIDHAFVGTMDMDAMEVTLEKQTRIVLPSSNSTDIMRSVVNKRDQKIAMTFHSKNDDGTSHFTHVYASGHSGKMWRVQSFGSEQQPSCVVHDFQWEEIPMPKRTFLQMEVKEGHLLQVFSLNDNPEAKVWLDAFTKKPMFFSILVSNNHEKGIFQSRVTKYKERADPATFQIPEHLDCKDVTFRVQQ